MHAALDVINHVITVLNTVSPGWYVVAIGPLVNIAQHFLKKEREYTHGQNQLIAVGFAALAGAFYGVLHTPEGQSLAATVQFWLKDTALVGSPIWLLAFTLYHGVSSKLEQRNELVQQLTPPAAPAVDETPAPAAPSIAAPESGVDAAGNVTV